MIDWIDFTRFGQLLLLFAVVAIGVGVAIDVFASRHEPEEWDCDYIDERGALESIYRHER